MATFCHVYRACTTGIPKSFNYLKWLFVEVSPRFESHRAIRRLERHLVVGRHSGASSHTLDDSWHIASSQSTTRRSPAARVDAQVAACIRSHKGPGSRCPEATKQSHAASSCHEQREGTTLGYHGDKMSSVSTRCFAETLLCLSSGASNLRSRSKLPQHGLPLSQRVYFTLRARFTLNSHATV